MRSQRRLVRPEIASAVLPSLYNGLLAGFHLDEISGNPIDFVGSLSPTLNLFNGGSQGETGKFDKCIYIDDGQINLNTNSLLGGLSQFTFAAWIKNPQISGKIPSNIATSLGGSKMYVFAANLYVDLFIGGIQYNGTFASPAGYSGTPRGDGFNLALFEWDGTTIRVSVDNQISATTITTPTGTVQKGTSEVIGGGYRSFQHAYMFIDEALYWDRALTTDEKTNLWNNGSGIIL